MENITTVKDFFNYILRVVKNTFNEHSYDKIDFMVMNDKMYTKVYISKMDLFIKFHKNSCAILILKILFGEKIKQEESLLYNSLKRELLEHAQTNDKFAFYNDFLIIVL